MIPGCRKWAVNKYYLRQAQRWQLAEKEWQCPLNTHPKESFWNTSYQQSTSRCREQHATQLEGNTPLLIFDKFSPRFWLSGPVADSMFLGILFLRVWGYLKETNIWWRKGIHSEVTTGHITNHTSHDWLTENFQRTCQQDRQGLGTWETRQREAE